MHMSDNANAPLSNLDMVMIGFTLFGSDLRVSYGLTNAGLTRFMEAARIRSLNADEALIRDMGEVK